MIIAVTFLIPLFLAVLILRYSPFYPLNLDAFRQATPRTFQPVYFAIVFAILVLSMGNFWVLGYAVIGLILARFDLSFGILPDILTLLLAALGIAAGALAGLIPPANAAGGAVMGGGIFLVVLLGFRAATGRDGLGWGDVKLMVALGIWVGPFAVPFLIAAAAAFGLVQALLSRKSEISFGPALIFSGWGCLAIRDLDFWRSLI